MTEKKYPRVERKIKYDIQEYKFDVLAGPEDQINNFNIKDYDLKEMKDYKKNQYVKNQGIIKKERQDSEKNSFKISPIVRYHRGIQKQEEEEYLNKIDTEVNKQLDIIKGEYIEKGRLEGIETGKVEAKKEANKIIEQEIIELKKLIEELKDNKIKIIKSQKGELVEMLRSLTKWVILRELKDDGNYLSRLLESMITELGNKDNLIIRVDKDHFEKIPEVIEIISKDLGQLKNCRIEIDHGLEKGIVIESTKGIIDGSLEWQLKSIDDIFNVEGKNIG